MSEHARSSFPSNDTSAPLQELADEVARIATTLSHLSLRPQQASNNATDWKDHAPTVSLEVVRNAIKARRLRECYFDAELFAEPAWDILLELLQAELAQYRVQVSSLCIAAHVPATTALRWIAALTDSGLLCRRPDPQDARRIFVELTPRASGAMHRYFADLVKTQAA